MAPTPPNRAQIIRLLARRRVGTTQIRQQPMTRKHSPGRLLNRPVGKRLANAQAKQQLTAYGFPPGLRFTGETGVNRHYDDTGRQSSRFGKKYRIGVDAQGNTVHLYGNDVPVGQRVVTMPKASPTLRRLTR